MGSDIISVLSLLMDIYNNLSIPLYMMLIFYCSFSVYEYRNKIKKSVIISITFLIENFVLGEISFVLLIVCWYLLFKNNAENKCYLLCAILMSFLISIYSAIIASYFMVSIFGENNVVNTSEKIYTFVLEIIFILLIVIAMRVIKVNQLLQNKSSKTIVSFLIFLIVITYIYLYFVHYYELFNKLVGFTLGFLVIETILVLIFIFKSHDKLSKKIEKNWMNYQLETLQEYTDLLESEQLKLRKFKHDYKNMMLVLKASINPHNNEAFIAIDEFEDYSDKQLASVIWIYKDMNNIKLMNLKSLIISKMLKAQSKNIKVIFECRELVNKLIMNEYDYLRIVGNLIDNAIEASIESESKEIGIYLYRKNHQFNIAITNTYKEEVNISRITQPGFSTKRNHSGLGLANIEMIRKNTPNLFIQYQTINNKFTAKVTLEITQ